MTHTVKRSSAVDFFQVSFGNLPHKRILIFAHSSLCLPHKCCRRRICFPAALSAAGTGFSVYHNHIVSHLACRIVTTVYNFAVDNNAAANARAERNHYKIFNIAARTCNGFAERRAVCIIFNINRFIKIFRKNIPCRHFVKA